jgi:hypothetical protein
MKIRTAFLLSLALACSPPAARAFIYETATELQGTADFDGDGRPDLIILEKSTGAYRVAYQTSPGMYSWVPARASGISGATGLGLGKLNSLAYDSLAVTGPDANRVNIIDANSLTTAGLPSAVFPASLGPNLSAAIDIGGGGNTAHADLYVASIYNAPPGFRQTLLRNDGTANRTQIADTALVTLRERANPVLLHTSRPPRLAAYDRLLDVNLDMFRILDLSGGSASIVASVSTSRSPQPWDYLTGQFVRTNAYTQFLFYPRDGWNLYVYQVTEPTSGSYNLEYTNQFTFTNSVRTLFVLPGTNDTRLLAFWTNGTSGTVFRFNGMTAPIPIHAFNAAPGEHFTGAGVLENSGFMAYSAPQGENTSTRFREYRWNGASYSAGAAQDLPRLNTLSASGNVMQFRFEPFVHDNPTLLRVNNAGDWSSLPQLSGVPPNLSVRTETFLDSTQGLVNPITTALGPAHPSAGSVLANQYSSQISLFSFSSPAGDQITDVTISPPPGLYSAAIQLSFSSPNPASDSIYFRIGSSAWQLWTAGVVAHIFTNAAVQYYGQTAPGARKTAIKTAHYTFSQGPESLDSDGDGVPDYVEIAKGLDPNGGADSDGDGYTDLEELIRNTAPLLNTSAPTNFPHLDERAAFDLAAIPRPLDGFSSSVTLSRTGTLVRAFNLQGSLHSVAVTTNPPQPVARLTNITIIADDRLFTVATEQHFDIATSNPDRTIGREMLALAPMPRLALPPVPYAYTGGSLATEANNWIISASNTFRALPRTVLASDLSIPSTLAALLVEAKVAQLLGQRGSNWWTNITLFPFRVADATRTNVLSETLLGLELKTPTQPGYKLQTMFATVSNLVDSPAANSLRAVASDIYRISSMQNNSAPATFMLPVDQLRYFLRHGAMDAVYLPFATTAGSFGAALTVASNILAAVPPRPTVDVVLVVRADTAGSCRVLDPQAGGAPFSLLDSSGLPFSFPDNFDLPLGSRVQIAGYTDVTNSACGYRAIEVTGALLASVPIASDTDADGNLLIDSWEKQFFGYLDFVTPFDDDDGDGYTNLQEMLEGSDPADFYGRPSVLPAPFEAPVLALGQSGGQMELHFNWPAAYIGRFQFGVRHTATLDTAFTGLAAAGPTQVSGDTFKLTFAPPATAQHFYYLTVALP